MATEQYFEFIKKYELKKLDSLVDEGYKIFGMICDKTLSFTPESYNRNMTAIYRKGDFCFRLYGLNPFLSDMFIVLPRGAEIPSYGCRDGMFSSSPKYEVVHIMQTHSGARIKDGPWWEEFRDEMLPLMQADKIKAYAKIAEAENDIKLKIKAEECRQAYLWNKK